MMILSEQKLYTFAYSNTVDNYDNEVSKYHESLNSFKILSQEDAKMKSSTDTSSEEKGGGCLIATATYGSEMATEVQQLRELRDNQLLQTQSGTQFMTMFNDVYYSFSPVIADYERENPLFKEAVKLAITPMISTLSLMENAESESEVLGIGLSVIALNLGMYLGAPAIVIIGIKKKF
jgi:peptidyl-prolyl cis-trans isomerase B (cyclophilin B)